MRPGPPSTAVAAPAPPAGHPGRRGALADLGLALAAYLAATAAVFWPYLPRLSQALLGPPEDNMQDLWGTWYAQLALDGPGHDLLSTRLVRWPEGASLLHHSLSYSNAALVFAVRQALGLGTSVPELVLLHNGALLLSVPAAALGAWLLARHLGAGRGAALAAGWIYGFSPWHVAMLQHHLHVASCQYLPFLVLFALRAVEGRRRRDVAVAVAAAVAAHALGALSSWYYLVYGTLFLALQVGVDSWRRRAVAWRTVGVAAAVSAGTALVLSPLLLPLAREAVGGHALQAAGHDLYVADLAGFLVFPPHHLLVAVTDGLRARLPGNAWEGAVYLGLANLALLALGWARARRERPAAWALIVAGATGFAIVAMGSTIHLGGEPVAPGPAMLLEALPLARHARTPARAIAFVLLFVGVGAALGLEALRAGLAARPGLRAAALAAAALAVLVDFVPRRLELTPVEAPAAYQALAADPARDFGLLDLPLGYTNGNRYMMYQLLHQRPIVAATLSRDAFPALVDRLDFADLARQRAQLVAGRVKYLVLHKDLILDPRLGEAARRRFASRSQAYREVYREVFADDRAVVYQVY